MVNALIALIEHPEAYCDVFNIGHAKEISIHELALLVKDLTQNTSEIIFVPYEEAYEIGFEDMARQLPDIAKIRRMIGYQPSMDLPAMLERIIAYSRKTLVQPAAFVRSTLTV